MKRLVLFISFFSLNALAGVSLSVGQLLLNQRDNMMNDVPQTAAQFTAGYAWNKFQLGVEYAQFATAESGNATLNTMMKSNSLQAVGQFHIRNEKMLRPYLSAGFGFEQIKTRISLYNNISEDQSKLYMLGFAGGGLRMQLSDEIHLATEGRLNFGEIRDPNPAWSMLVNLGITL